MSKQVSVPKFSTNQAPGGQQDWQQYSRSIQGLAIFQQTVQAQPQPAANGSIGGYIQASMPFQGGSFKVAIIRLVAMEGVVTYVFPTSFDNGLGVIDLSLGGVPSGDITSLHGDAIEITTATPTDGLIVVIGN